MVHTDTSSKSTPSPPVEVSIPSNSMEPDIFSETSTLRSLQLNNFDGPSYTKDRESDYGKSTSPVLSPATPSLDFDPSYLSDKLLPTVPPETAEHEPHPHRRSRSPGRRKVLKSHRRLPSRTRESDSRSPETTPLEALAKALGPDNVAHTSELDSIPCAGIRIPSGPFMGLLAWRLVVRVHPVQNKFQSQVTFRKELALLPQTDIRLAGNMPPPKKSSCEEIPSARNGGAGAVTTAQHGRAMSEIGAFPIANAISKGLGRPRLHHHHSGSTSSLPLVGKVKPQRSMDSPEDDESWDILPSPQRPHFGWQSSHSLPMFAARSSSPSRGTGGGNGKRSSWMPTHAAPGPSSPPPRPRAPAEVVVTNFLFDTSQAHNSISRETLHALGFSERIIDGLESSAGPAVTKTLSLYVQNAGKPITFVLASPGEPSRLGVQFLTESEVNVCMGEGGRGAVIWLDRTAEKKMLLHDVPRTVPLPKLSLQARVRTLFGLSS